MRSGRDCVAFLRTNFRDLETAERWLASPLGHSYRETRVDRVFEVRMNAARKAGTLTIAEAFRIMAWHSHQTLYPGFLDDPIRCDGP